MKAAANWLNAQNSQAKNSFVYLQLAGVLDALLAIGQAFLLAAIAHQLTIDKVANYIFIAFLLTCLIARALNSAWRASLATLVEVSISEQLRLQLTTAIFQSQAIAQSSAAISNAVLEQTTAVGRYHGQFYAQQKVVSYALLIFLLVAFWHDWIVGLIFLFTAPLIPVFMVLVGSGAQQAADKHLATMDFLGGYFLDRLKGALTLRAFAREAAETKAVDKANEAFRHSTMSVLKIAFLSSAVLELFAAVSVALIAVYVGLHLLNLIQIGPGAQLNFQLGLFLLLLAPEFYAPLRQLTAAYHERANGQSAAKSLHELLGSPNQESSSLIVSAPAIQLQGVSFSFADNTIIKHLSMQLPAGQCLVVRGDSGTGKSSLLKLMAGFLSPDSGQIAYQFDHLEVQPPLAAQSFAWLGQNPWFMHGTIAENLRLARADASNDELMQVLQETGLSHLSLATSIDEQGVGISGGEGRRLALARLLLSQAPLWFLDEPTAELDESTESVIVELLKQRIGKHTVVIATHSEACASLADHTIRIDTLSKEAVNE